jgi:hypothetical protein
VRQVWGCMQSEGIRYLDSTSILGSIEVEPSELHIGTTGLLMCCSQQRVENRIKVLRTGSCS